ncbi:MAG TPA: TetR/AcrR family transcriptional regulator [Thermoleophilaceae bacterium]|nr:TetR/AcrR family transcriptional regulator [Thermoleophilaceae bacterium]
MAYRATPRTEARRLATRERIVAAALDRVSEGGYASAGVQSVARDAGIAVGSVYRHFPSKAELFAEVFRRAAERELAVVQEVTVPDGRSTQERIAAAVEAFSRRALASPTLAYALIAEPADPAVEAERLRLRCGYRDAFAHVLEEGVLAGELRPHDSQTVAAALVGALAEALVGPLSPAGGPRKEALVAGLVQFCLDALPKESHDRQRIHA